jgi:regulatory protein
LKVRSELEVRTKLDSEGFSEEVVEAAVNELKAIGYINDQIYAQKYIFDRSKLKPKAKKLLRYELEKKGVPSEIIDEALEDFTIDEGVLAESLIKKKYGKYDMNDEKTIRRIYSFLQHRGFSFGIINEIVNKIKQEN